jgi:hypothetical protein
MLNLSMDAARARLGLHRGELVEVRSAEEILASLGPDGSLDGLPFMPEMLQYCGRRFRVLARAHKTCDTVNKTGGRRLHDAVHLDTLRCDGAAHGGCQAACLLFFKEAWLKRVDDASSPQPPGAPPEQAVRALEPTASHVQPDGERIYRCQATELPRFTTPLSPWDWRQYVEDLWSGNVGLREFLRVMLIGLYNQIQMLRGGRGFPSLRSLAEGRTAAGSLGLKVGERVRIRSKEEIELTLKNGRNRGLWFDVEMVPYCGRTTRVQARVERIIDERSGRMMELPNDCLMLEDVYCRAHFSRGRLLCPRRIVSYYREVWLERVDEEPARGDAKTA